MKKVIIIFTVLISMLCFSSYGTWHVKLTPAAVNTTEPETINSSTSEVSVTFEGSEKTEDTEKTKTDGSLKSEGSLKTEPENAASRTSKTVNSEGNCAVQDGRIYYANHSDDGTLYSMNIDGSDNRKLNDDRTPWFYVSGDRIYYKNEKGGNIYVMNTDGSGNKKLNEDSSENINVFGDRIYYCNWDDDYALYSMDTDGSDRKKLSNDNPVYMNVVDNRIYYFRQISGLDGIYSTNTNGTDKIKLTDDIPYGMTVADGWIYYNIEKDSNELYALYAIRTDGSDRHKLMDDYARSINVAGDQVYYINGNEGKPYRVNKDGSNRKLLSEDCVEWICVFDNRIYYTMSGVKNGAKIYSMDTDGGDKKVIKDLTKVVTYEITRQLSKDMPKYRFVATGKTQNNEEWGMGFVMGLKVYDEKDHPLLSKDNPYSEIDEGSINPVFNNMMDTMGLHVTDVNFDGYKDVIILSSFIGNHSNTYYDCWLWNQKTSSFVKSESFSDICNPALDPEKKCIYSCGSYLTTYREWEIYQYIDGKFVVANNLSYVENDEGYHFTEQKHVNGKMKTLRDDLIKAGNFNDVLSAAGYIGDKVWQLDNPRWYMNGGHHADQWLD